MARPSKLTEAVHDRIIAFIRNGNFLEPSARAAGIHPATFFAWMERGEADQEAIEDAEAEGREWDGDRRYAEFREAVTRARAEAELTMVAVIRTAAAQGDAKSAQWYLERAHRERWAQSTTVTADFTHRDGVPRDTDVTDDDAERLMHVASVLADIGALPTAEDPEEG